MSVREVPDPRRTSLKPSSATVDWTLVRTFMPFWALAALGASAFALNAARDVDSSDNQLTLVGFAGGLTFLATLVVWMTRATKSLSRIDRWMATLVWCVTLVPLAFATLIALDWMS